MSEVKTLRCDECGKLRVNDSNHWLEGTTTAMSLVVAATGKLLPNDPRLVHFCGQACALKWVGIKLSEL